MIRTPNWLQVALIILLLASAIWAFFFLNRLLALLFAIGGLAFLISFLLRRMIGDDYGRT